eukprot:g17221.t1
MALDDPWGISSPAPSKAVKKVVKQVPVAPPPPPPVAAPTPTPVVVSKPSKASSWEEVIAPYADVMVRWDEDWGPGAE